MKAQNQVRITNENVRITADNVQHIGECSRPSEACQGTGRPDPPTGREKQGAKGFE